MVVQSLVARRCGADHSGAGNTHVDLSAIGPVPHGWRVERLGDLCEAPEYGAPAPARPFDPSLPRYIRITDLTNDGRLRPDDARSADPSLTLGFELKAGDLLFARSGATAGKTYLYQVEDGPCTYAGYLIRFRPISKRAIPRFVELWTHSTFYRRWLSSMSRIGAQPNINAVEYASLPVLVPPLAEQETIVRMLGSIEDAIESTESVLASLKQLRHSLQHQLLARGMPGWHSEWQRLPTLGTVPAGWQITTLGDIARIAFSSVDKKSAPGEIPVKLCNYTDVFYNRRVRSNMDFMTATATTTERNRWKLESGDVVFTKDSETRHEIGVPAYVAEDIPDLLCGYHLALARPRVSRVVGAFLMEVLASDKSRQQFARIANGTTRFGLTLNSARALPIALPRLIEQRRIVAVLSSIDDLIDQTTNEIVAARNIRFSVSEGLLTGRVRMAC